MTQPTIKIGQRWIDVDVRNTDRGKTGKAKPKYREVEIISLPTLSSPGTMKVVKSPKRPDAVGKLREFTRTKLIQNYALIPSL
jgi:hypothetical protein